MVAADAAPIVRTAAHELADYLRQIYPNERFATAEQLPESGRGILVGCVNTDPQLKVLIGSGQLAEAESYLVTTAKTERRQLGHRRRRRPARRGVWGLWTAREARLRVLHLL